MAIIRCLVSNIREYSREKKAAFLGVKTSITAATTLDELAQSFGELVKLIHDYKKSALTAACLDTLDTMQSRLCSHHEFLHEDETSESFSALLTKSLATPIQNMTAQLQAQHHSIQSLAKSMHSVKAAHLTAKSHSAPLHTSSSSTTMPPPKPMPVPITTTPDEHILQRCDGNAPPILRSRTTSLFPRLIPN
ncbi:hypothetical protein B0H14DRAFT_2570438 [Mycena olivaceomarginata]|nr:hypothetical protein B0H14DRAFT_2570438 [Mycena olivaceomarginata]